MALSLSLSLHQDSWTLVQKQVVLLTLFALRAILPDMHSAEVSVLLQGSVQRLEASSNESNQALANRCKLDLAKAGFNVPAAPGTDEIKAGQ